MTPTNPARLGNPDNIRIMTKIDLSCGHARAWEGDAGTITPGVVWQCSQHGNQVIIGVEMSIDGTARDAWEWIAQRIGRPGPVTVTEDQRPDQPIPEVEQARRPAHRQGDLGRLIDSRHAEGCPGHTDGGVTCNYGPGCRS